MFNNKYGITFGSDPEFFFATVDSKNKPLVISPGLLVRDMGLEPIGGDGKHPVFFSTKDFNIFMDGVAFEINLTRPHNNPVEMHRIIRDAIAYLDDKLQPFKDTPYGTAGIYKAPVVNINPDMYLSRIDDDLIFQGFIFGCDRDYDAIDTDYECKTLDVQSHPYRYGGGHAHFGGYYDLYDKYLISIKLLAILIGNYCVGHSPYPKLEAMRSKVYGRPGRYRQQTYKDGSKGIEYRTPSNSWVSFTPEQIEEMFGNINKVCYLMEHEKEGNDFIKKYLNPTIEAIIHSNQKLALDIINQAS